MHNHTITVVEEAYAKRNELNAPENLSFKKYLKNVIKNIITELEIGNLRVALPTENNEWQINTWIKKAILLSFIINESQIIHGQFCNYLDKIPPRFTNQDLNYIQNIGTRIVPPAYIRNGAYIGKNTIIMPSFINIGAFIDDGTMIDS